MLWNLFFDPLLKQIQEANITNTDKTSDSNITDNAQTEALPHKNKETETLDVAFADDLMIMASAQDPSQAEIIIEKKLKIFTKFLEDRGMEAADHKLRVMPLDLIKRNYEPTIHHNGKTVKIAKVHRFLGVYYDKDMNFREHWKIITASITNRIKTMMALKGVQWGPTIKQ